MVKHPCQHCGACCAFFRASLHWSETLAVSYEVPESLTVKISPHESAMLGTNQKNPRCVALIGEIGKSVQCSIYENRPDCCRIFAPSFEDGLRNEHCEKARIGHGLGILSLADWV